MQPGSTQHMPPDQLDQWRQACRAGADPIGHRRDVELDALAGKAVALAVERLVMAVFGVGDHRQFRDILVLQQLILSLQNRYQLIEEGALRVDQLSSRLGLTVGDVNLGASLRQL